MCAIKMNLLLVGYRWNIVEELNQLLTILLLTIQSYCFAFVKDTFYEQ